MQTVVVRIKLGKNCLIYGYIPIIERISMGSKFLCDVFSHISTFITTLYLIATCPIFHNWTMHYICNSTRTESQTTQCAIYRINWEFWLYIIYLIIISYSPCYQSHEKLWGETKRLFFYFVRIQNVKFFDIWCEFVFAIWFGFILCRCL